MTAAPIERAVRSARRRLILQSTINRLVAGWAVALVLGLGWVLAEPWLMEAPAAWLKWAVVGGLAGVATIVAGVLTYRAAPSRAATALEVDSRFGLRERVTTALNLRPEEAATSAGSAVLADAAAKVAPLAVRSRFPVSLGWPSASVPALAGCLALAAVFYHPNTARTDDADSATVGKKPGDQVTAKPAEQPKKPGAFAKKMASEGLDRANKSEKLKELENELEKLMDKFARDPDADKPERQREKVTELTALEEKAKKFDQEKFEKLARMEQQLRQLDRLKKDDEFGDGLAKPFADALAKGDLKKAKEEVDELKKKAKNGKLDEKDQEKLANQLDKIQNELQRLAKNKEREKQLKDLVNKAKQEGRNAEALERELEKMRQENKDAGQALEDLAQKLEKAKKAAEKGDLDELAETLESASKELGKVEEELKDLEDADEFLQRLKEERCKACERCKGGKCKGEGEEDSDLPNNGGIGKGRRPENPNAQTTSEDERIRGLFDPRGRKSYGGTTRGQAFNKRTTADMGTEIREAVQDAPNAPDAQRLPRDAKDAVREYFQNLGGQAPGGNR